MKRIAGIRIGEQALSLADGEELLRWGQSRISALSGELLLQVKGITPAFRFALLGSRFIQQAVSEHRNSEKECYFEKAEKVSAKGILTGMHTQVLWRCC